jgi:hypothetical protein
MKLDQDIKDDRDRLNSELIWLNLTVSVARKIIDFPWTELNVMGKYKHFANVTFKNNFEYTVVIIRKLYYDTDKDCLTLPKLKNKIVKNLTGQEKTILKAELKPIELVLRSYADTINDLRNERIAHKIDPVVNGKPKEYYLTFNQLELVAEQLNKYFRVIGHIVFNTSYELIPMEYNKKYNKGLTDFELVLEKIALESDWLRLKENRPETWDTLVERWIKNGKLNKHLEAINKYRDKLGLEEITV